LLNIMLDMLLIDFITIIITCEMVLCVTFDKLRCDIITLGIIVCFGYYRLIGNCIKNKMNLKFWGRI
jgi:hypothetical protein